MDVATILGRGLLRTNINHIASFEMDLVEILLPESARQTAGDAGPQVSVFCLGTLLLPFFVMGLLPALYCEAAHSGEFATDCSPHRFCEEISPCCGLDLRAGDSFELLA